MIDLFDLLNRFYAENNIFQGGWFRPESDYERVVNSIGLELWDKWTGQAEKSQEITDELAPFLKSVNSIVSPTNSNYGLCSYPKDYARYSSARILLYEGKCVSDDDKETCQLNGECVAAKRESEIEKEQRIEKYKDGLTEVPIYKVDNSRWGSILTHRTKKPTFENPALTQYDNGFKVAPRQVPVIVLDFYIKPSYAKFAYTLAPFNAQTGAGGYIVYNANQSTKLQWNETMIPYFLKRLGEVYSKYTRDTNLFQMTNAQGK